MKGVSSVVLIILLLLITIALVATAYLMSSVMVTSSLQQASERSKSITAGLNTRLTIEDVTTDKIFVRNIGSEYFNGTLIVYINKGTACARQGGTTDTYKYTVKALIQPQEVFPIEIGCCINEGVVEFHLTSGGQVLASKIKDVDASQVQFYDWENATANGNSPCFCLNYGACDANYKCTLNNVNGLENTIKSMSQASSWYLNQPPYLWSIIPPCCKCSQCFTMLARSKFFYNSNSFAGKSIWLAGDANFPACQISGVNGIYINDNMYVLLNDQLIRWNGTSYGGIWTGSAEESKQWCIPPVDLSGSTFSKDCDWNNVTIAFEDYCGAGGVYGMYLKAI
jgi:hypothetical protein